MILKERCLLVAAFVVLSTLASAQHTAVPPVVHPPVAPMRVTPPIYRAPVVQTPIIRPPIIHGPAFMPPRSVPVPPTRSLGTSIVLPPVRTFRPIRPVAPVVYVYRPLFFFGDPFWRANSCFYANCNWYWPWTLGYTNVSSPGPVNYVAQVPERQVYVYGGEREDFPQLFLKDGTVLNVTDYWVVDGQLHFKQIEAIGQKPVEQSIPFAELDLQKTVDANTARGFRFVLRNEPVEEYVRHHPEPPPALTDRHQ
jgi:hypothetical protein